MMRNRIGVALTVAAVAGCTHPPVPAAPAAQSSLPVFLMDGPAMERVRVIGTSDSLMTAAIAELRREADGALDAGPFSVTEKTNTPPSGDKHDYMSIAPYWWPNPNTPDRLPYIGRDGEVNPEVSGPEFDGARRNQMYRAVRVLTLAWYYTRHEDYGRRAALLLRTWFLDPETRMNPHLRYGQAVPGGTDGRSYGIVETADWVYLVDIATLLSASEFWTPEDQRGIRRWFGDYLEWLLSSEHGRREQRAPNNHGTWYDAQVVTYSLFTNQPEVARRQLRDLSLKRMESHFSADGSQPRELERTRSFLYSLYNLRAFFILARLAENLDMDLWNHPPGSRPVLRRGLDYLLPTAIGSAPWPHREIGEIRSGDMGQEVLPLAIRTYDAPAYRDAYRLIGASSGQLGRLMFPGIMISSETPGATKD